MEGPSESLDAGCGELKLKLNEPYFTPIDGEVAVA